MFCFRTMLKAQEEGVLRLAGIIQIKVMVCSMSIFIKMKTLWKIKSFLSTGDSKTDILREWKYSKCDYCRVPGNVTFSSKQPTFHYQIKNEQTCNCFKASCNNKEVKSIQIQNAHASDASTV